MESYNTQLQYNTVHSITLQIHNCNNQLANHMTTCLINNIFRIQCFKRDRSLTKSKFKPLTMQEFIDYILKPFTASHATIFS